MSISSILTKEYLEREYVQNGRFAKDIAKELGCSAVTVRNYIVKHNIPIEQRYDNRPRFQGFNPAREIMTKDFLHNEYIRNERSMTNIARELDCSPSLVREMLQKHGFNIEDRSKHQENCGEVNGYYSGGITTDREYLIIKIPNHHLADHDGYVRLHDLLAEYYFDHVLECDEVVHHINENRQDNRSENLQIMKKVEHDRYHTQKRWDTGTFKR